ncbi:MAG: phage portal protein, partial [Planctomycetota bacterium]|nr:phage portal protein [Planctomycetota bacterium]
RALAAALPAGGRGGDAGGTVREVVIENDIAWRIQAMVDFMFGRPVSIVSTARDEAARERIELVIDRVFEASGGAGLLQDMALLGAVHGHVGLLLRTEEFFEAAQADLGDGDGLDRALRLAERLRVEIVEAPRSAPLLAADDYRRIEALIIRGELATAEADGDQRGRSEIVEIHSARARQVYADERLVAQSVNRLGALPFAHIQNISQPFRFEGLSEVEPLIPLQDELNTRLSDRANRVTMQSFKMYLARGVDSLSADVRSGTPLKVGPGQVWTTENTDAGIDAFGGDGESPSEDNHIEQIRQALDKTSSVTPIAAGVIRARVGQLSSENALRITMMGLLAKTARKQVTYGRGLTAIGGLILRAMDIAGVMRIEARDMGLGVQWPDPLPRRELEALEAAEAKERLGVPRDRVLAELGYAPSDLGVT